MKTTADDRQSGLRAAIRRRVESPAIQNFIMVLIVINAVILGLETVPVAMANYGQILVTIDHLILGVFVVEILLESAGPCQFAPTELAVYDRQ